MRRELRGLAIALVGLALIVAIAGWLAVHIAYKVAILIVLAIGTVWLASVLSRPHPQVFGPTDTDTDIKGERR